MENINGNVWESILSVIKEKINHQSFDTWFRPVSFASTSSNVIYVVAPNEVFKNWILEHYSAALEESLMELNLQNFHVSFLYSQNGEAAAVRQPASTHGNQGSAVAARNFEAAVEEAEEFSTTRF